MANNTIDRLSTDTNAIGYIEDAPVDQEIMGDYWPLALESLFPSIAIRVSSKSNWVSDSDPSQKFTYLKCTKPPNDTTSFISCSDSTKLPPSSLLTANDPSLIFADPNQTPPAENENENANPFCSLTWRDPSSSILSALQSLAFHVTLDIATSSTNTTSPQTPTAQSQTVLLTGHPTHTLYHAHTAPLVLAILLSLCSIACILPLYTRFWDLGRKVSLDPLEIARAFGAPVLDGIDGNATADVVALERCGMVFKYGALERHGQEKRLRVEEASRTAVRRPWLGDVYG